MSLIYSVASEVSRSDLNEPGCELLPSARSIPTPGPCLQSTGQESPVTTTCEPSPPIALEQMALPLMLSAEGSPARTSARLEMARALKAREVDCGASTAALLANYDHATSSWRTSQHCLLEGLTVFSETWPRSGTMQNGIAFRLPPLVPYTDETAFGLWATPTICGNYNRKGASKTSGDGL